MSAVEGYPQAIWYQLVWQSMNDKEQITIPLVYTISKTGVLSASSVYYTDFDCLNLLASGQSSRYSRPQSRTEICSIKAQRFSHPLVLHSSRIAIIRWFDLVARLNEDFRSP